MIVILNTIIGPGNTHYDFGQTVLFNSSSQSHIINKVKDAQIMNRNPK